MQDSDSDTEFDVFTLQIYRNARLDFNERIVKASVDASEDVVETLRTDMMYQLAEFYYLLSAFGIVSTTDFDGLLERHNDYLTALLADPQKMSRMGLTKSRVLKAIFDGETRPRVLKVWADAPGTIDQSSLARLLVGVMSDETARKTVVACASAGFLARETSVFRMVLVRSNGVMERIYGDCIRQVRLGIQALGRDAGAVLSK